MNAMLMTRWSAATNSVPPMMARGSVRAGSVLSSSATQIGPYQPSKATSTERRAMTIAATIAIDMNDNEAAESAGAAAVNAGAGVVIKQPTTTISSMRPTETEMVLVPARPSRRLADTNPHEDVAPRRTLAWLAPERLFLRSSEPRTARAGGTLPTREFGVGLAGARQR
jgi:hypothetical protein